MPKYHVSMIILTKWRISTLHPIKRRHKIGLFVNMMMVNGYSQARRIRMRIRSEGVPMDIVEDRLHPM